MLSLSTINIIMMIIISFPAIPVIPISVYGVLTFTSTNVMDDIGNRSVDCIYPSILNKYCLAIVVVGLKASSSPTTLYI